MIPTNELRTYFVLLADKSWHPCSLSHIEEGDIFYYVDPDGKVSDTFKCDTRAVLSCHLTEGEPF